MLRRIFVIVVFLFIFISSYAYKSVSMCGNISFSAQRFEGKTYLIMIVEADKDKHLLPETILKFKMEDGTIMRFGGVESVSRNDSRTAMGMIGTRIIDETTNYILFEITDPQIQLIDKGIKAAIVNTVPEMYRVSFTNNNFSKSLYKILTDIKETDE